MAHIVASVSIIAWIERHVEDLKPASGRGGFYGWPYAYIGRHPQLGFATFAPDKVDATITPDLLFEAHSSVLDLVFYSGDQFPSEYQGGAFVALKGS
jgi:glucose/arabinose dehydrogenase